MGRYRDSGVAVGVGDGSQTSIEQDVYENTVGSIEDDIAEQAKLVRELEAQGAKFNELDMLFAARDPTGQIVWLEKGNSGAGLEHIERRHAKDFESKFGIAKKDIPAFIRKVVRSGTMVSDVTTIRGGRKAVQRIYEHQGERFLLVAQGSNGFIVTAYPVKKPKGK